MTHRLFSAPALLSLTLWIPSFAATPDQPSPDTPIVEINGVKVTLAEFERQRPNALFHARNTFYEGQKKAIARFVDEYLLEAQAKKENLTVPQLLEKHITSTLAKDPSEESLRVYFEGVDTTQTYEEVRPQILEHIRQNRYEKAKAVYMKSIAAQAKIAVLLKPPRAPLSTQDTPVRGPVNAAVTILEYADYECPYCQQAEPILTKVMAEYKDRVAFAYKDVPLPMHPHAQKASEATRCADAQGKFWEFHDALYTSKLLDMEHLKMDARDLKLDGAAFDKCLDSGQFAELVKTQSDEGRAVGIEGTPSFFVNGRFVAGGLTYEDWKRLLDEELRSSKGPVATALH